MKKKLKLPWIKLRASARRASADEYLDEEPTMRLSSAMILVFLLHVVAIGGIWAFNRAKDRAAVAPLPKPASLPIRAESSPPSRPAEVRPREVPAPTPVAHAAPTPVKLAAPAPRAADPTPSASAHVPAATGIKPSGETYTVVKGDNPYSIAKKHHVSYEALLALNGIQDARKLRIGQVLQIPAKQ